MVCWETGLAVRVGLEPTLSGVQVHCPNHIDIHILYGLNWDPQPLRIYSSVDLKALQHPSPKNLTGIQQASNSVPLAHKELSGDGSFDNLAKYKEL